MDKHRDEELPHELVDLFIGGVAVVPGDLHPDVGRDDLPLQFVEPVQQALGHGHGVGAQALGHGHGHRRVKLAPLVARGQLLRRAEGDGARRHRLFGAVDDLGHVPEIDRLALVQAHQEVGHLVGGLEERPGLHQVFPVLAGEMARRQIDVAHLDGLGQRGQIQAVARQARRVGHHPHLALAPGHHVGAPGVGNGLQAVQQFVRHPAQLIVVGLVAVQGQGDDGHVVDAHGLDHPARHALRAPGRCWRRSCCRP